MVNVSQVFSQTLDSNKDILVDWLTPVDRKMIKYFRNVSKDRRERGIHNIYVCSQLPGLPDGRASPDSSKHISLLSTPGGVCSVQ